MDNKSKIRLELFQQQYSVEYEKLILIDQNFYNLLRYTYFNLDNWEDNAKYTRPYKNNYFEMLDEKQKYFIEHIFLIKN